MCSLVAKVRILNRSRKRGKQLSPPPSFYKLINPNPHHSYLQTMRNAHVNSILTLAEPFRADSPDVYSFGTQDVSDRVRNEIPVMLRERLTPPPDETYSLHRKLSGAFLLCAKLKARIECKKMFREVREKYLREGVVV